MVKNNSIDDVLKKIITLINKNDLKIAEKETKKALEKFPNNHLFFDLMGSISIKKNEINNSIKFYQKALSINSNFIGSILNLGVAFQKLGKDEEALLNFRSALKKNPKLINAYNNIGFILNRQGKYNEAISNLKKATEIDPSAAEIYLNMGISYQNLENYEDAISNYKTALALRNNFYDVYFNLGEIYKKIKDYKRSLEYFLKSKHRKTNEKILECLFLLNLKTEYSDLINNLEKKDPNNRGIAAVSSYFSQQFSVKNTYSFCPNPMDFILKTNLIENFKDFESFLNNLFEEILKQDFVWEPYARTTNKGFATKGNLSELNLSYIKILERYLSEEIEKYRENFKEKKIGFINAWPKNYSYMMWSNRLKKEGFNKSHIHPSGWLSGVFYLRIPKKIKNDEAGIEFSTHGGDFEIKKNNIPKKILTPQVGDLVMFPSSLYHKTIPFESDEERVCIAFDIIKID